MNDFSDFMDKRGRTWEWFIDPSYYSFVCIRVKGETNFNSHLSFHFPTVENARSFVQLLLIAM